MGSHVHGYKDMYKFGSTYFIYFTDGIFVQNRQVDIQHVNVIHDLETSALGLTGLLQSVIWRVETYF